MHQSTQQRNSAFTIVELLIVIVVIAILAAIVTVAYTGIQKQALTSMMKDTLSKVSHAMEVAAVGSNSYAAIPNTVQIPQGIGVALTIVADSANDYCINATTTKDNSLSFHLQKGGQPTDNLCDGDVIEETIAGDYNTGTEQGHVPQTPLVELASENGHFRLSTGEAWSTFVLSWDAVEGATRYEVQTRNDGGAWYYRYTSDGSSSITSTSNGIYSWNVPSSTTSLNWTSSGIKPTAAVPHEYRWRSVGSSTSDWQTIRLAVRPVDERTHVNNFSVAPSSGWASMILQWDAFVEDNNIPSPVIEVQTRDNDGAWYYRFKTDGSSSTTATSNSSFSWNIPASTTSLTWTSAGVRPEASGSTHEYRIRIRSSVISDIVSDWTSVSIAAPTTSAMSKLSNFTVTPANDWSNLHLAWSVGDISALPDSRIEIQTRDNNGSWYYRFKTDGSSSTTATSNSSFSWNVSPSTASLDWTSATSRPSSAGVTHEYRIRLITNVRPAASSDWITVSLTAKTAEEIGAIQNFTVTPTGTWNAIQLNWSQYTPVMIYSPLIQIQTRTPDGTWSYRYKADGSGSTTGTSNSSYSWNIPVSTTSLTWTSSSSIPAAGTSHEYRIRVSSTGVPTGEGPWATFTLTRP